MTLQSAIFALCYGLISTSHGARELKTSHDMENQLYEDLLFYYNKVPRPVKNSSNILTVYVGASLIRIIDVDEKNQVLTTNLWLEMVRMKSDFNT